MDVATDNEMGGGGAGGDIWGWMGLSTKYRYECDEVIGFGGLLQYWSGAAHFSVHNV